MPTEFFVIVGALGAGAVLMAIARYFERATVLRGDARSIHDAGFGLYLEYQAGRVHPKLLEKYECLQEQGGGAHLANAIICVGSRPDAT